MCNSEERSYVCHLLICLWILRSDLMGFRILPVQSEGVWPPRRLKPHGQWAIRKTTLYIHFCWQNDGSRLGNGDVLDMPYCSSRLCLGMSTAVGRINKRNTKVFSLCLALESENTGRFSPFLFLFIGRPNEGI